MSCVSRLKAFFNKENFDYSNGYVDPYEFHKTFHYATKIFRVVDNEPIPKWTIIVPTFIYFCGVVAAALFGLSVIHNINIFDISVVIESGTYLIVMLYKLLIISCTLTDKPHYPKLLQAMRDDFEYICSTGSKYREKFFQNHLWTWKATILSTGFILLIGGGLIVCAKLALVIVLIYRPEGVARPLPFPVWCYDVDFEKSPTYEIVFLFLDLCVISHCSAYIFMMQTQIVWIRQIMSKADVIIWTIEDLLVDVYPTNEAHQKDYFCKVIKNRMANIIKMHHSMYSAASFASLVNVSVFCSLLDDYAAVYLKLLIYEQKLGGPLICLIAYCAVEKLDEGEFPGILILLCTSVITVCFIPSYLCTMLAEKVQSIGDACWNTPFWNAPGKVLRPYFILIMQRSLRRLPIHARGFADVSLETFADRMTFAYSGFNMLRQANFEI